ncbi:DUF4190 domain-containing protein [Rhodococcus sp. BP-252]|uniref:DUF4190 domain-containing protein n=1 Tax=Rhodococcoides kyotonense TaxID=398843 RepID=A0A177Y8P2_9NOCA|nr:MULTISPECIES: DUF4190 domain-containing protein [Rhodococcus]MBY6411892.1 DUF4190 domain-containing protein [Rhodococcus sp. BP-320]MBY6416480.1 DUF4190 domain-containing protein [Rhodococcus sp. BP-321]MBY6420714.1 DUF4190 domain-containing protein [Rhodococcus sp. BP-324]MBY6426504.1 DUF4190 domain-containing protein [Rhodococcus sp. BP-323]MBY6431503.1 DUF4190 domain-containing protein [Rhodococcus sp. BP-322]
MAYQQGPYPGYRFQPPRRTNTMAIGALICGVFGLFTGIAGVVAVVLGHIARNQIKRTGEQGAGIALAGLILGYLSVVLLAVAVTVYALVVIAFVTA